jgi:putative ABC transport system permease protein
LDILAFGIAAYGLFTFNNQRELMAMAMVDIQSVDPLLFLSASLFIIGLGLIALRIFPYFVKLIFFIGKKNWSPAMYASMLKVMRSSGEEQFIMIFLVFTMAVGIFSAQSARTINLNADHMILYQSGADITFRERWMDNQPPPGGGGMGPPADMPPSAIVYFEPDFARFTDFDEVDALARVFRRNVIVTQSGSTVNGVRLMGINTQEFGETIWTREDLHPIHINHFLNTLSQRADAVLLSDNFRTRLGFSIGDGIVYRDANNRTARGVVYGFVEHWPGYAPVEWVRERTGETTQNDVFLMVANLGFLQTTWGVMPYEVWMRTNGYSNRFFYDFVAENNLLLDLFQDTSASITDSRNDPIRQGTNGVLTVSFIVTLLICFTGFLIYWILSIKSRVLQFGIFRAMGLSMRNIISLLINEQLFITLMAVVIGAVVGEVTARLFVPLIQISYTAADQIIPLMIVAEQQDYFNLYGIVGMMIVLCLIILGILISKIKIAQALKLGED